MSPSISFTFSTLKVSVNCKYGLNNGKIGTETGIYFCKINLFDFQIVQNICHSLQSDEFSGADIS